MELTLTLEIIKMNYYLIEEKDLNKVLGYLSTKSYKEVNNLINDLCKLKTLASQSDHKLKSTKEKAQFEKDETIEK